MATQVRPEARSTVTKEAPLDNNTYNLMSQMVEEHRSLWRIKDTYMKDARGCPECEQFWKSLITDKEDHIKRLQRLLDGHFHS